MTGPTRWQRFDPVLFFAALIPLFGSCLGDANIEPPDDGGSVDVGGTGGAVSIGTGGNTGTGGAVISGSGGAVVAGSGGANTGGASTGGSFGSGGATSTGGVSGSGANTGGASTGGRGTGGANTGGASTGGRGTGGASTGGAAGGRAGTGGTGTGGRAATGGNGTGGRMGTGGGAAGGASSMAGRCPATLSCPNGITCGCYLVAGLGANKMALLNAGATQYMLASAMMETEMMDTNYPAGDNKTGDSYNAGTCKQNWGMAKVCHPAWNGQPASAYSMMAAMNSSRALDVQVYNECRAYYGDRWWAGHRNGASGLNNPNTTDINNFKAAEDWTNSMLTGHTTDDVRFWVTIPPIIVN